jgi:hypothetical protein
MEENEFRSTYRELNARPCVFEKAILARCGGCEHAQRLYLAEREGIGCGSPDAYKDCAGLLGLLREKALFALHLTQLQRPLGHGKELKLQCGGLRGLDAVLGDEPRDPQAGRGPNNIHALVKRGRERFESLQALPYARIMQEVARFRRRRRLPRPG